MKKPGAPVAGGGSWIQDKGRSIPASNGKVVGGCSRPFEGRLVAFCLPKGQHAVHLGLGPQHLTALEVLAGAALSRYIPADYIKLAAGAFFVIVGVWTLYAAFQSLNA